jgi:hypothetical protein
MPSSSALSFRRATQPRRQPSASALHGLRGDHASAGCEVDPASIGERVEPGSATASSLRTSTPGPLSHSLKEEST